MASFNVNVPHQKSRDQAADRLRQFSDIVLADLPTGVTDVDEQWQPDGSLNFAFKAMGMQLSGNMVIGDKQVEVTGTMPFAALPFRGAIQAKIEEQINKALV